MHAQEAQLAIGDLTITVSRSRAVDFTLPFMHTGIGILYRRPVQGAGTRLVALLAGGIPGRCADAAPGGTHGPA
ncbi:hypothetical protein HPB52_019640 [Rhipicephalus sanguineus]|uniref:Ionotropic glutamate receptor L-glutamate and glycine-binding domain-containing protein n=1 Tax=Rhipicephalus sanguineus TaxID=34632 RepID=A0A9D4PQ86_RHISA|nr:hypothetical protein HPB52_019640 [Rhipicephalus sanguineus]